MKLSELNFDVCPPVLTAESMRALDALEKNTRAKAAGMPKILSGALSLKSLEIAAGYGLMKNAGRALYNRVVDLLPEYAPYSSEKPNVAVFVGGGNNGGDGLVLAKLLLDAEISCIVFSLAPEEKFRNEAALALEDFLKVGGALNVIENPATSFAKFVEGKVPEFSLIVDCMLGNGASGELKPAFAQMASLINKWKIPVLSADAPTGYDSKEHCVRENCIVAKETMLFGMPRIDAYVKNGGPVFGKVQIARLDYAESNIASFAEKIFWATDALLPLLLPERNDWGDKREQGSAVIVAGSANMPGAAALCTGAALRSGAGLVTLATPKSVFPIVAGKLSEPVFLSLECVSENLERHGESFSISDIPCVLNSLRHANAFAIGPGLSANEETQSAVVQLLKQVKLPTVIDADALNAMAAIYPNKDFWNAFEMPAILTPHIREYARLFGELPLDATLIPAELREKSRECGKVIVLKGAPTFVALPNGIVYLVPCANSGMAKGGSGDVLTGILVALLSQGVAVEEAAVLGVLIHQRAGEIAKKKLGAFSMLPSDVIECLAGAF